MKHQLAIYSNNQADGINRCLCADPGAAPAEATRLQPVQGLSEAVRLVSGLGVESLALHGGDGRRAGRFVTHARGITCSPSP